MEIAGTPKTVATYRTPIVSPSATVPTAPLASIVYPIVNFNHRITKRAFGTYVTSADRVAVDCGYPYVGYHTGDDLEVMPAEIRQAIPVYSIADGVVRQAGTVEGYGGLIVAQYMLAGQTVTVYYGHVNIGSATVKSGDHIRADQKLALLGDNCSSQTAHERKHLHFAIHRGTVIDVRGYVPTKPALSDWIDPKTFLSNLHAGQPSGS